MDMKLPALKSDKPTSNDALDFGIYRDTLCEVINVAQTPMTIGIFGAWGSGKTSLMKMIQEKLAWNLKTFTTAWFNAWKYDREDALWRALILHVIEALRPVSPGDQQQQDDQEKKANEQINQDLDRLEESLYHTVEWNEAGKWTVNWGKALGSTVEGAAEIALTFAPGGKPLVDLIKMVRKGVTGDEAAGVAEAFQHEMKKQRREQVLSVEQFEAEFSKLVKKYLVSKGKKIVIFVDDLDRCLPEKTLEILEAIKLFLDAEGCIFVLGFDLQAVDDAIQKRFSDKERRRLYLEKIVQLPFILPPIEIERMNAFLEKIAPDLPVGCREVFASSLGQNPRQVKRVINIFLLLWQLARRRPELNDLITPVRLAKVVVIQNNYPDLYNLLRLRPGYLSVLEEACLQIAQTDAPQEKELAVPAALQTFVKQMELVNLLAVHAGKEEGQYFKDLSPQDLRAYIFLTYRAPISQEEPMHEALPFEPEMVHIKGGKFQMGISKAEAEKISRLSGLQGLEVETPLHPVEVKDFEIGKYPVMNLEYAAFVRDSGYGPPAHWKDGNYPNELSDHPVVNVSWEDAQAYCTWLNQKTGKNYRLPAEAEWEYAARGDDQRRYPWGDEFSAQRCNTLEGRVGGTTPAGQYSPGGDSPFGVADMAGNVWEWTGDFFAPYAGSVEPDEKKLNQQRSLRGGSWENNLDQARTTHRKPFDPKRMRKSIGFRVVCDLPAPEMQRQTTRINPEIIQLLEET